MSTLPIVIQRSPSSVLFDYALASAYQIGSTWIPNPDYALEKDPAIYEKASRDPVLRHAFEQRLHSVAGRDALVAPRSGKRKDELLKARIHEELLEEISLFSMSTYQLAKAVLQGSAYGFVEGERRWISVAGLPEENWWVPTRIRDVNWRRVRYATGLIDDAQAPTGRRRDVWMELFSIDNRKWSRCEYPERLIRFIYDDEEAGLNYGLGLMAALYHYYFMKGLVLREGIAGVERWARGIVTAGIDAQTSGGIALTNRALRESWMRVMEGMASRHAIVHDSRDTVEVHNGGGEGHQMVMSFVTYLDDSMTRLLLGSARPTGGGGAGEKDTGGSAYVEQDSTETLIGYDRRLLWEYLTRDLGGLIERRNRPQFYAVGCDLARAPRYKPAPVETEDHEKNVDILDCAFRNKVPVKSEEAYELLGLSQPGEGDEVLEGAPEPELGGFGDEGGPPAGLSFGRRRPRCRRVVVWK